MERHQGHRTCFSSFWHRGIQSNAWKRNSAWTEGQGSDQSSSQDRVTELIIENYRLPRYRPIFPDASAAHCAIGSRLRSLWARATCKCCFIDDPLLTELVDNWWTGRMETQSITLARVPLAERNELNLKPSSIDCLSLRGRQIPLRGASPTLESSRSLRDRQPGFWGVETLRSTQATTWNSLSLAGLPLLPGEQQELFTEPIISSATQCQT